MPDKKLQTWQIWHAMRKILGDDFVMAVLGRRNARTIRMYAQDPRCTFDRCKDPLEALAILFDELETCGRADIAKLAIAYLQQAIGCQGDLPCPDQLKQTLDAEVVADFQAVSKMQAAIAMGASTCVVRTAVIAAKDEIDCTFAKYFQDSE